MSQGLESAIRDLLIVNGDSDRVAKALIKRMQTESPSRNERLAFTQFLIHAGYYTEVLQFFADWFKEGDRIPLYAFCYLLYITGNKPNAEFLKYLFIAQYELHPEDKLKHVDFWSELSAEFTKIKNHTINEYKLEASRLKERLYTKLEYYRNHRMIQEEEKLLDEMILRYPEDALLKKDKAQFKERWASAVIANSSYKAFNPDAEVTEEELKKEEIAAAEPIIKEMTKLAQRKRSLAYNFAIGLFFIGHYESAKEILKYAPSDISSDWFLIELLIKCRRYVECLDAIASVETKYADDPETTFAAVYYRALALRALGQTEKAAELMRSIVSIRPSYRSAHALLLNWGNA